MKGDATYSRTLQHIGTDGRHLDPLASFDNEGGEPRFVRSSRRCCAGHDDEMSGPQGVRHPVLGTIEDIAVLHRLGIGLNATHITPGTFFGQSKGAKSL